MEKDAISHFIYKPNINFSNELYRIIDGVFSFHHYVWNEIAVIEGDYILIKYTTSYLNIILKILKSLKQLNIIDKKVAFVSHLFDDYIVATEYDIFFNSLNFRVIEKFSEQGFDIFDYIFNSVFLPNRYEHAYGYFLKKILDMRESKYYFRNHADTDSYILAIERKVKIEHLTR